MNCVHSVDDQYWLIVHYCSKRQSSRDNLLRYDFARGQSLSQISSSNTHSPLILIRFPFQVIYGPLYVSARRLGHLSDLSTPFCVVLF